MVISQEAIRWENFATVRRAQWCRCREDSHPHIWLPQDHPVHPSDHDRVPPSLNWELHQFQDDARFAGIIPKPAGGEPNHPGMWTPDVNPPHWLVT
jgi:site-specific DNA-cytosine methylase